MADSYVTSGAKIRCSCGDKMSTLTVYPDRTCSLTGKPLANVSDHVTMRNIAPFGKCHSLNFPPTAAATAANHGSLTPMLCVPGTFSKWQNGKNDYIIKGDAALLKSSYCKCCYGGTITIVDDGQVDTGKSDLSRKSSETEDDWNEKEIEELLSDKEVLLEGLQTALDVAGFAPGVGAIADLTNAAIYAVRGDKINAGLSLLSAVPGIGDAAAAAKLAGKGVKAAKVAKLAKVTKTANAIEATSDNISNVKFGQLLLNKNTTTVKTPSTSPYKFGEITLNGYKTGTVPVNTTPVKTPSTSQYKFGEITQIGHKTGSIPVEKVDVPKPKDVSAQKSKCSIEKDVYETIKSPKCNDGPLKEVFKYKGKQPSPEGVAKNLDLDF